MNTKDLIALGVPPGEATRRGLEFIACFDVWVEMSTPTSAIALMARGWT